MAGAFVYHVEVDGIVRYVGKGRGKRMEKHMVEVRSIARRRAAGEVVSTSQFYNRLTKAWLAGAKIELNKIADGLSDVEAFELEASEVAQRSELWNSAPGGRGGIGRVPKPSVRDNLISLWQSPEYRAKMTAVSNRTWAEPGHRDAQRDGRKANWADPSYRKKQQEERKSRWADPVYRAAMSEKHRERANSPDGREKMEKAWAASRATAKPKVPKGKCGEAQKAKWADPAYRAMMTESHRQRMSKPDEQERLRQVRAAKAFTSNAK